MDILFYHSSLKRGGAERVIVGLSNYFVELGHNVSIILINEDTSEYDLDERVSLSSVRSNKKKSSVIAAIKFNMMLVLQLHKQLSSKKPDIVVCFGVNQLLHAYIAKIGVKCKLIGAERANPFEDPCGKFWKRAKRFLFTKVDGFIFQTEGAKSFYPCDRHEQKITIIQNPIAKEIANTNCLEYMDRKDDMFCSIGRLEAAKAYDFLIKSFCCFRMKYPKCKLVIWGEGRERGKLESLIKELDAESFIMLPGRTNDVAEKLQNTKFFVLSSKREGMPNTLIEAMAMGCVCVATDCEFGPRDIIKDGWNGIVVENQNVEMMVSVLEKIYLDKNLQIHLSENAREVRNTNSMEQIGREYLEFFEKICRN